MRQLRRCLPWLSALGVACLYLLVSPNARASDPVRSSTKPSPPRSRVVDPADDSESLVERAAAALVDGRQDLAAALLEQHVEEHPEAILVRAQLAELLFRMERFPQARHYFETFIALAQIKGDLAFRYLIHSHSRLVDIALAQKQAFDEHLHRGIGLFMLAERRAMETDQAEGPSATSLLARAVDELQSARQRRPREARVHWYLHRVYHRLGQPSSARSALQLADQCALQSRLTPQERLELALALLPTRCLEPLAR